MNKFKTVKQALRYSTFIALSLILLCCDDSDLVNPADPIALSKKLNIPGSTKISADFPSPSPDPLSPVLDVVTDSIFIMRVSYRNIFVSLKSGSVKGLNIKVKGANDYFSTSDAASFINVSNVGVGFSIITEDWIQTGTFVIQYSVYDDDNRVSNIVERTVIIIDEVGGEGSAFLSSKVWNLQYSIFTLSNPDDTIVTGKPNVTTYSAKIDCIGQPDKNITITEEYIIISDVYTLSPDGTIYSTYNSRSINYDNVASVNACSPQYLTEPYTLNQEGRWSYYHPAKRLMLSYGVDPMEYIVSLSAGNTMRWKPTDEANEIKILK